MGTTESVDAPAPLPHRTAGPQRAHAPQAPATDPRARAATELRRAIGSLSTTAIARMDDDLPWFRDLGAEERSWVGLILQSGVRAFVDWYGEGELDPAAELGVASSIFGVAPRALTGTISLRQTVDLVRLSIRVIERDVDSLLDPAAAAHVRSAVLRYAREVAFATAEVYARAAEARGAWDARLEALVVDAVLRAEPDETLLSRASALGWRERGAVAVVLGAIPASAAPAAPTAPTAPAADAGAPASESGLFEAVRRAAREVDAEALCAAQGERLVVVLGGVDDDRALAAALLDHFGEGPVVVGPVVPSLATAHRSARAALAAHRAAAGWPAAPRPVTSEELLPERALAGDGHARRHLVDRVFGPIATARGALLETLDAYLATGASTERAARALFVHPNTVRYRLRQVADVSGLDPTRAREAFVLQVAVVLGRQYARPPET